MLTQQLHTDRDLEEDAKEDEEIAEMLQGTGSNPEAIRSKVNMGQHAHVPNF